VIRRGGVGADIAFGLGCLGHTEKCRQPGTDSPPTPPSSWPGRPIRIADPTGVGDAFRAGYLAGHQDVPYLVHTL
jgi:hypothetical protein